MLVNYVFTLDSVFKMVLPKTQTLNQYRLNEPVCLTHGNVLLSYANEAMYLIGNLPFFKIHVHCFMAWDDLPCAKVISKCMFWERGLMQLSQFGGESLTDI